MRILFLDGSGTSTPVVEILSERHQVVSAYTFADAAGTIGLMDCYILGHVNFEELAQEQKKELDLLRIICGYDANFLATFVWYRGLVRKGKTSWDKVIFFGTVAEILSEGKVLNIKELVLIPRVEPVKALLAAIATKA